MESNRNLETTGQDWANYLSHEVSGNGMIYLVALLSSKPNEAIFNEAIADLVTLQPVLGCRFDERQEPPVWIPIERPALFSVLQAENLRQGMDKITQYPASQRVQLHVTLLSTPGQWAVCLRFDHASTDGNGALRCLALLTRCYQQRLNGSRNMGSICLDRSEGRIYARCGLPDYRMALKRETPDPKPVTTVPYVSMNGCTVGQCWISFPLSAVKRADSTINDCLLAAYAMALTRECSETQQVTLHMTVDLRRYLETDAAPNAGNLSGMVAINLEMRPHKSYDDALSDVKNQMALLKTHCIGLSSAAMVTYLRTLPYAKAKAALWYAGEKSRNSGEAAPILSNLGQISPSQMAFGEAKITSLLPLLPVLHASAFMLGASSYVDTLTLSAGVYLEERSANEIEHILASVKEILMKAPA